MADDFSGKIDVVVDYKGTPSGSGGPSSTSGGGGNYRVQNIEAQDFLKKYSSPKMQTGVIRALKAQEAANRAQLQEVKKAAAEAEKDNKDIIAEQQRKANEELIAIQKQMALTESQTLKINSLLERATNRRLSLIQMQMAKDQEEHQKTMQELKEKSAREKLRRQQINARRQRYRQNMRAGGGGQPESSQTPESKSLALIAKATGFLAATFGAGIMLKNSKVANTFLETISKLLGTMIDVLLMPWIPLLVPLMQKLAAFVQELAAFMRNPTKWLSEKLDLAWIEKLGFLNKPIGLLTSAAALLGLFKLGSMLISFAKHPLEGIMKFIDFFAKFKMPPVLAGVQTAKAATLADDAAEAAKPAAKAGKSIWETMQEVFDDWAAKFDEAKAKMLSKVKTFFDTLFDFSSHLESVKTFFGKIFDFSSHAEKVSVFFRTLFDKIAIDVQWQKVQTFFNTLFDAIAIDAQWQKIVKFFDTLFDFSAHLAKISNFFKTLFAFEEHWQSIKNFFTNIFGEASVGRVWTWIEEGIKKMFSLEIKMSSILKHIFGEPKKYFSFTDILDYLRGANIDTPNVSAAGGRDPLLVGSSVAGDVGRGGNIISDAGRGTSKVSALINFLRGKGVPQKTIDDLAKLPMPKQDELHQIIRNLPDDDFNKIWRASQTATPGLAGRGLNFGKALGRFTLRNPLSPIGPLFDAASFAYEFSLAVKRARKHDFKGHYRKPYGMEDWNFFMQRIRPGGDKYDEWMGKSHEQRQSLVSQYMYGATGYGARGRSEVDPRTGQVRLFLKVDGVETEIKGGILNELHFKSALARSYTAEELNMFRAFGLLDFPFYSQN